MHELQQIIENAWSDRSLLQETATLTAINEVITLLDSGKLRVAAPTTEGWKVNDWVKKAVILYFPIQQMETIEVGIFEFHDKVKLKNNFPAPLYTEKTMHLILKNIILKMKSPTPLLQALILVLWKILT